MTSLRKHLTKHGNSYALIIDRPIMELLKIDPNTPLEISTPDGESLVITPKRNAERKKRFDENLDKMNKGYNKAFKRLAEE